MPKKPNLFTEKLEKLEAEKNKLIEKRRHDMVGLIEKVGYLGLEDEMLVGMILFCKENAENGTTIAPEVKSILDQIKAKGTAFFRRKQGAQSAAKKQDSKTA